MDDAEGLWNADALLSSGRSGRGEGDDNDDEGDENVLSSLPVISFSSKPSYTTTPLQGIS